MKNFKIILEAMTPEELEQPEKVNGIARQRIAQKSGQVMTSF